MTPATPPIVAICGQTIEARDMCFELCRAISMSDLIGGYLRLAAAEMS
jgi:hypothetical protein